MNNNTTSKTAVIYARVSSIGDRQNTQRQVSDLTSYAQKNDINVLKVYEEHISGAKKIEDRPVFSECLRYAKDGNIDLILFNSLDRCGRSIIEVNKTVNYLADNSINAFFQKENLYIMQDGKVNPITYVITSCLGMCAEFERENIKWRLNSGLKQYVESGGRIGRPKGSVKPKEKKQSQYKEVISCLKKGYKIRDVAKLCSVGVSTVQRVKKEFVDVEV